MVSYSLIFPPWNSLLWTGIVAELRRLLLGALHQRRLLRLSVCCSGLSMAIYILFGNILQLFKSEINMEPYIKSKFLSRTTILVAALGRWVLVKTRSDRRQGHSTGIGILVRQYSGHNLVGNFFASNYQESLLRLL